MLSVSRFTLKTHEEEAQLSFSVKQGDTARRIVATMTEDGEMFYLSDDCYAVFAANKSDGTKFNDSCVIQDGRIIYDLDPQLTLVTGRADCDITIYDRGGAVISTARFVMVVFESIFAGASDEMVSEDTFHVLNNLIGDANDTINDMEDLNDAVTAAEALRVEAENAREEAEDAREEAETARETAESARASAEAERISAEEDRDEAEDARTSAETARASAEEDRDEAEDARASAEAARVEAEAARVEAEQERVDVNTGIVAQATAAASTASTAASTASTAAQTAATAADVATAAAGSASGDAEDAESAAIAAESWTQGGTGTREGEDTNNAYYWYTQAQSIAGGDYAPRIHTHVTDDITDFPDTMPPSPHTHSIEDITDYTPEEPPELTEGTTNGTVNYDGVDVPVHGLGSAAFTSSTAYDSAGTAAAMGMSLSESLGGSLNEHIGNKSNPHDVTCAQVGAAAAVHTHSIDDITDYTPEEPPELTEGTTNGTVNYGGVDVPVHGLGSAAFTSSTAYDSAGTAAAAVENAVLQSTDQNSNSYIVKNITSASYSSNVARVNIPYNRFVLVLAVDASFGRTVLFGIGDKTTKKISGIGIRTNRGEVGTVDVSNESGYFSAVIFPQIEVTSTGITLTKSDEEYHTIFTLYYMQI